MPNVMLAARSAASASFQTLESVTDVVSHSASALSELALAGAVAARDYRRSLERSLVLTEVDRVSRWKDEKAIESALFRRDIMRQLDDDPALKTLFVKARASYDEAERKLEAVAPQLHAAE